MAGIAAAAAVTGAGGVAVPAAAPVLLAIAFVLLAAAAAFVLDEPSSDVVDLTPTGAVNRTVIRALALVLPLGVGVLLIGAGAVRGIRLPWPAVGVALAGDVAFGFIAACIARIRTGEPGARAATAVVLVLIAPGLLPPLAGRVHQFPSTPADGRASWTFWAVVLMACALALVITFGRDLVVRPDRAVPAAPDADGSQRHREHRRSSVGGP